MISAHVVRIRNSAHKTPGKQLGRTGHLKIREVTVIDFKTYLHRLTANLAVLDIRLLAATWIQQNAD